MRLPVVVEFAFDPFGGAMVHVDGRPETIFEVEPETRVRRAGDEGVESVGECAAEGGILGRRTGVGFVPERAVAVDLEFGEDGSDRGLGVVRFLFG